MKECITGISGFVGAELARRLVADGVEVHGLVRPTSDLWRLQDIATAINRIAEDARLREELVQKGRAGAKNFSWDETARQFIGVIKGIY